MAGFDFLLTVDVFKQSLGEQKAVLRAFWKKADQVLKGTGVELGQIPRKWFSLRHNYFSVLFIVVFHLMNIPPQRLKFYARINHCLRTWVTACDNLLDDELKELIITDLPEKAKIFKSVHTVLAADRIFFLFLREAVKKGVISDDEMELLLSNTMTAMSESGREEAEEEGGVDYSVKPEAILHDVHMSKTGRLFTSPLSAPFALGDISMKDETVKCIYEGLAAFGIGCQILDDLSDLGTDLYNQKFNYVASVIMHSVNGSERARLIELVHDSGRIKDDHYLYQQFSGASKIAMKEARDQFHRALDLLCRGGLPLNKTKRQVFIKTLLAIFGHPKLLLHLRG
jgi:hypothetical protein